MKNFAFCGDKTGTDRWSGGVGRQFTTTTMPPATYPPTCIYTFFLTCQIFIKHTCTHLKHTFLSPSAPLPALHTFTLITFTCHLLFVPIVYPSRRHDVVGHGTGIRLHATACHACTMPAWRHAGGSGAGDIVPYLQ